MSKEQFWILNAVGGICALLLLINVIVTHTNTDSLQSLQNTQNQLMQAQQLQTAWRNLALRVAQEAQTDPALKSILERQNVNVTLPATEGKR